MSLDGTGGDLGSFMVNPTSPGSPRTPSRMASRGIPQSFVTMCSSLKRSSTERNRPSQHCDYSSCIYSVLRRAGLDTGGQAIKSLGLPPTRDWRADITSMRYSLIAITAHPVVSSGNAQRDVLVQSLQAEAAAVILVGARIFFAWPDRALHTYTIVAITCMRGVPRRDRHANSPYAYYRRRWSC